MSRIDAKPQKMSPLDQPSLLCFYPGCPSYTCQQSRPLLLRVTGVYEYTQFVICAILSVGPIGDQWLPYIYKK